MQYAAREMNQRHVHMGVWCLAGLIGLMLLVPTMASAQGISGTVTDSTGGVLPGVTVEVRSPVLIEQVRTAITDGNGRYLIVALELGTYSATYTLPGFSTLVREGIELSTGFTATIDVQLVVGDIQETVTVTGASPVVDIQNVEQRAVFDREIIDSIPTGKSYRSYALLVPGMGSDGSTVLTPLTQDAGGMAPSTLTRMVIHGSADVDQQLEINGMDVGDSRSQGSNYSVMPDANYEELSIDFSGNSAEVETGGVRINVIPREGSNQFSGGFFTTFSFPEWHANNIDRDLQDRGLSTGTLVDEVWTVSPVIGGPIVQDKLWFFLTHTTGKADLLPADIFFATDPRSFVYVPDLDSPSVDETTIGEQSINLTWQASSKDKVKLYWTNTRTDKPVELQSPIRPPESAIDGHIRTNAYQGSWTRPQTNRLLFEAGASWQPTEYKLRPTERAVTSLPGIGEFSPLIFSRNMSGWFRGSTQKNSPKDTMFVRGSMSYVTGSHHLKIGMTSLWLGTNTIDSSDNNWTNINTFGGFPIRASFHTPRNGFNRARSTGIYAQEQWTADRLTLNAGLRFDNFHSSYPDHTALATVWAPQDFFIEGRTATSWQDLQPRLGVAYDLSGDGRTALKFSANRAGQRDSTDWSERLDPSQNNARQRRSWNDGLTGCLDANCIPGDGLPQGDPLNPLPNGELRTPNTNPAFGLPLITTFFDEDWSRGWGNRHSNWEFSASIQQEVASGVALDVGYFRRAFVSFSAEDDRNLTAEDFDQFQVPVPNDPRLPNAGEMITLVDLKPGSIRLPDRITTHADNFGGASRTWQGVDITADARVEAFLFQGGVSTGAFSTDRCAQLGALPENQQAEGFPIELCKTSQNWLTQVKFLASYSLPYDIEVAAALQNQEGPERSARVTYRDAVIAAALGRPTTSGNQTVNVIEPGTQYGERFTQFDLRITKIFALGGTTRLRAMLDFYNLFNANAVVQEQSGYPTGWLNPLAIMPGRLAKVAFQIDF